MTIDSDAIAYLNGEFVKLNAAKVSVLDRGFLFGDGVYEVIPAYGGHLFRFEHHMQRLERSLRQIGMDNPFDLKDWSDILESLIDRNTGDDQSLYLQITRGVAPRDHAYPADTSPTIFCMSSPLKGLSQKWKDHGAAAITLPDQRWPRCDIKSTSLLPNVLLRQQAVAAGCDEAILIRDGYVTEGAASNIFMVSDGVVITPSKTHRLLFGVTRDLVIELLHANNMAVEERDIPQHELAQADEIWLTSSTREILPVVEVDGVTVSSGKPGPHWQVIFDIYQTHKNALRDGSAQ